MPGVSLGLLLAAQISLQERAPLIVVPTTPKGVRASLDDRQLFAVLADVVGRRTHLLMRTPEQAGLDLGRLDACPLERRMGCWAAEVDRSARDRQRSGSSAFLLLLTVTPATGGSTEIGGFLLDVEDAVRRLDDASLSRAEVENQIFSSALRIPPQTTGAGDLAPHLEAMFDRLVVPFLAPKTVAMAEVEIRSPGGLVIKVDGRTVGETTPERTVIGDVAARPRALRLEDRAGAPVYEGSLKLQPGATTTVVARVVPPSHPGHAVAVWTGVGLSVVGVALIITAAAAAPSGAVVMPCAGADCVETDRRRFAGSCEVFGGDAAACSDSPGVLMAPLGFSIALTGGLASVLYGLIADDPTFEWWWSLVAIGAGGLTYGLAHAID